MVRTLKTLSDEESARLRNLAAAIESERPEIDARLQRMRAAAAQTTFSGQLRRAIHAVHQQEMFLPTLLERANVSWDVLEPFLLGDSPLPGEVIDRLVDALQLELHAKAEPEFRSNQS